jgi:hypothetical protein
MNANDVAGSWRVVADEPAARRVGDHAYYLSASGELVLTRIVGGGFERSLLTWVARGQALVIDQPSAPREEVLPWLIASATTMQIDGSWYLREEVPFDREAPWLALVAGAVWHGVASASAEPFIPFLMVVTGHERRLIRLVGNSAADAEAMALAVLGSEPYEHAVWVRDGRIVVGGAKHDAVIATRYLPAAHAAGTFALPYRLDGERAHIAGALEALGDVQVPIVE